MLNNSLISKSLIKHIKKLRLKKYRIFHKEFVIEGHKIILEALSSDFEINQLIVSQQFYNTIENKIKDKIDVYVIEDKLLNSISIQKTNNSGIAIIKQKTQRELNLKKNQYYLVLENISDPGNLGTIIRIADWFGIKAIICSQSTVDHYNSKVIQSSMGSFLRIPIYYKNLLEFIENTEIPIFCATLKDQDIHNYKFPEGGILIIGNESKGISKEILNSIEDKISIPRYGGTESLNAAMATAIICDKWRNYTNRR
ncbi:MAG: RNA methyltransferase [Bacteroidetes bacterium]|nr:RNA methyltransferase [Bacteroidota bacterium]